LRTPARAGRCQVSAGEGGDEALQAAGRPLRAGVGGEGVGGGAAQRGGRVGQDGRAAELQEFAQPGDLCLEGRVGGDGLGEHGRFRGR
jgi:hypothetical protein